MSNMKMEALIAAGDQHTITLALTALHAVTTRLEQATAEIENLAARLRVLEDGFDARGVLIDHLDGELERLKKEGVRPAQVIGP